MVPILYTQLRAILVRIFCFGIFDVQDSSSTGRPVVENVCKIMEIIKVNRHVSSRSIAQELKMDQKTALNHIHKALLKKLDIFV